MSSQGFAVATCVVSIKGEYIRMFTCIYIYSHISTRVHMNMEGVLLCFNTYH